MHVKKLIISPLTPCPAGTLSAQIYAYPLMRSSHPKSVKARPFCSYPGRQGIGSSAGIANVLPDAALALCNPTLTALFSKGLGEFISLLKMNGLR
jgi:hypothetical protein